MRYISINNVKDGDLLGKDLYFNDSKIPLIRRGAKLTSGILRNLKERGYTNLCIDDEITKDIVIDDIVPLSLKYSIENALVNIDINETINLSSELAKSVSESKDISVENYNRFSDDDKLHALLVAELSIVLGKTIGYYGEKLDILAASALLHDIGKTCVDKKEMEKYGIDKLLNRLGLSCSIDEYRESIHSFLGYSMLNCNSNVSAVVKQSILFHHENVDGSGELGVPSRMLSEISKIIHITNDFSRMITNPEKFNLNNTNDIVEYFTVNSGTKYDSELVQTFFTKIPLYPPGISVLLSNNMNAIVMENNIKFPSRPKLLFDSGLIIDLTDIKFQSLTIVGVDFKEDFSLNKTL